MEKTVQFLNSKGNKLSSLFYPGDKKSLIILCHGFGGCKDDFGIKQVAIGLNKAGYSTFIFDFTGQGKSEGSKDFDLVQQVNDLKIMVHHFKREYNEIIVFGGSMGGLIASLTTFHEVGINKLILVNPFLYLTKRVNWNYTKYLIGTILLYPFSKRIQSVYSYYFKKFTPSLLKVPTLIIVGEKDVRVSPSHSHQFNKDIPCEKKLISDNEIDHELSNQKHVDRVVKYVVNWLKK